MIVSSDLAVQWSVNYQTLFREQYNPAINVERAMLSPILMAIELPDFQGDTMTLDWLGAAPQMRKWVDEKRAVGLGKQTITVKVEDYEATVEIHLNTLRDARGNIYFPRIREMADNAARLEYNLVSDLIKAGETGLAYDGQNFFDTDHSEGDSGTQSNELTGGGTSVAQLKTDFYKAKAAMMGFKDDKGEVLHPRDFRPLLWIPNDQAVIEGLDELRNATLSKGGDSNILKDRFDVVVDPRLTDTNDWYMFRTTSVMKPFILINREEVNYEDNFGSGHPDVWSRRIGQASAVARKVATYGMWQCAVKVKNT